MNDCCKNLRLRRYDQNLDGQIIGIECKKCGYYFWDDEDPRISWQIAAAADRERTRCRAPGCDKQGLFYMDDGRWLCKDHV